MGKIGKLPESDCELGFSDRTLFFRRYRTGMKLPKPSHLYRDSIDLAPSGIERCEPRLALSASLMGAWLAPLADPFSDSSGDFDSPVGQDFLPPCPAVPVGIDGIDSLAGWLTGASPGDIPLTLAPAVLQPVFDSPTWNESLNETLNHLDAAFAQSSLNSGNGGGSSLLEQSARIGESTGFNGQPKIDGSGQTIAVIDTGIAYDHHAFGSGFGTGQRVVGGWDFAENDADPYDDAPAGYHGSHVAGLASGMTTTINGDTFRGVAPGADLVALRVFDDAGSGNLGWIEQALRWVHDNQDTFESPLTTVNLSLGAELNDANRDGAMAMLEDELQMLYEDDILVFAAAGNSQATLDPAADDLMYPASSSWVSAVGSIDTHGNLSGFSQRADGIYAAEGQQLLSSVPEHVRGYDGYVNDYASLSGTSMASPQVAAASMLVRQAMQAAGLEPTSASILQRLESTSIAHTDPSTGVVYRTLDLEAAVDFANLNGGDPAPELESPNTPSPPAPIGGYVAGESSDRIELDLRNLIANSNASTSSGSSENGELWLSHGESRFRVEGDSSSNSPIIIDAGGGGDVLHILGSAGSEQLTLRPLSGSNAGHSQLVFPGGVIELRGFEHVSFVGGGGADRATMYDSGGDDELRTNDGSTEFSGRGFEFELDDVDKVFVYATAGGEDVAHLNDTVHNDQLVIRPQFSSLRGGDEFRAAFGFERVFAYADAGGHDTADLGDSAGNDVMSIGQDRSLISGVGYRASATGFENVVASASRGGEDTVRIYVDDPGGTWHTSESLTQWNGADGKTRVARGFEHSEAFERFDEVYAASQSNLLASIAPQSIDDLQRDGERHRRDLQRMFEDYI